MYLRHNFYMITGVSVQHHVWCLSPVFFKTSSVETHDSASKNEEGCELDKHSSCLNHVSMSKDNRNRNAPHSWCSSHKFSSIYPTAWYIWKTEKKIIKNKIKKSQLEAVWDRVLKRPLPTKHTHVYQSFIYKVYTRIQVTSWKKKKKMLKGLSLSNTNPPPSRLVRNWVEPPPKNKQGIGTSTYMRAAGKINQNNQPLKCTQNHK